VLLQKVNGVKKCKQGGGREGSRCLSNNRENFFNQSRGGSRCRGWWEGVLGGVGGSSVRGGGVK